MSRYILEGRPVPVLMHIHHDRNWSAVAKKRFWSSRILFPTNQIVESWHSIPRKGRCRKFMR